MDITKEESLALQDAVDFISNAKYRDMDGQDMIKAFPMLQKVLRVKMKIDAEIRKKDEETMEKMVAKASSSMKPKEPIKENSKK